MDARKNLPENNQPRQTNVQSPTKTNPTQPIQSIASKKVETKAETKVEQKQKQNISSPVKLPQTIIPVAASLVKPIQNTVPIVVATSKVTSPTKQTPTVVVSQSVSSIVSTPSKTKPSIVEISKSTSASTSTVAASTASTTSQSPKEPQNPIQSPAINVQEKKKRKFGWKKQPEDARDYKFSATFGAKFKPSLPAKCDIRNSISVKMPIHDQGSLSSCTANAMTSAYHFDEIKQHNKLTIDPSRLFVYYNARVLDGNVSEDCGATLRNTAKTVAKTGICNEVYWPYIESKFSTKPPNDCYTEAKKCLVTKYYALNANVSEIKQALCLGIPIVFGIQVYSSFYNAEITGIVPNPDVNKEVVQGGHALKIVAYDDSLYNGKGGFCVENSWGSWGMGGYLYISYEYVISKGSDFWAIQSVSDIITPSSTTASTTTTSTKTITPTTTTTTTTTTKKKKVNEVITSKTLIRDINDILKSIV
jgi:C1A family cysteine protease